MDREQEAKNKSPTDVNTASFEEIGAFPNFNREKMQSSDEFEGPRCGSSQHQRSARPDRGGAELAADEEIVEDEPAF